MKSTISPTAVSELFIAQALERVRALNASAIPRPRILEWGSGESTRRILATMTKGELLSIEHDTRWCIDRPEGLPHHIGYRQVIAPTQLPFGQSAPYVSEPLLRYPAEGKFDLILIDGRQRADCAAMAALLLNDDGAVLLHDAHRPNYKKALSLFVESHWLKGEPDRTLLLKQSRVSLPPIARRPSPARGSWGVCAVAIPRESQPWLRDWVKHHLDCGASRVTLYDNTGTTGSTRRTSVYITGNYQRRAVSKRMEPYGRLTEHLTDDDIRAGLEAIRAEFGEDRVEIVRWRPLDTTGQRIVHGQVEAYADWVRRHRDTLEWGVFLDVDEYLWLAPGLDFASMFAKLESHPDVGVVRITQRPYGKRWGDEGPLEIRELRAHRPVFKHGWGFEKVFAKLARVTHANVHTEWGLEHGSLSVGFPPACVAFSHYNLQTDAGCTEDVDPRAFLAAPKSGAFPDFAHGVTAVRAFAPGEHEAIAISAPPPRQSLAEV